MANNYENLSFEGGGGKGVVYLGVIKALERIYRGETAVAIIDIFEDYETRLLKRISGASAGAITAFMISIGMTSKEIRALTNLIGKEEFEISFFKEKVKISPFEAFFEDPNISLNHVITKNQSEVDYKNNTNLYTLIKLSLYSLKGALTTIALDYLKKKFEKDISSNILLKKVVFNNQLVDYLASLLLNRGLFVGNSPRELFKELLDKYVLKKFINKFGEEKLKEFTENIEAEKVTFKDFFRLTRVDLVIMGTNINYGEPRYFSVHHTPSISVVDAIAISMSIPLIFKPVYLNVEVKPFSSIELNAENEDGVALSEEELKKEKNEIKTSLNEYNEKYKGLYVDGGMLINFPIHAFDKLIEIRANVPDSNGDKTAMLFKVAGGDPLNEYTFNNKTIGFMLKSPINNKNEFKDVFGDGNKEYENNINLIGEYSGLLLETFLFNSSKGQINNSKVVENTVPIDCGYISTTDFSSPAINKIRKTMIKLPPMNESRYLEEYKKLLINSAGKTTLRKFGFQENLVQDED